MTDDTHNQLEPFPTDGEVRDYEAAESTIGLSYQCVFAIGEHVFRYYGLDVGEAVVSRLSEPGTTHAETIPLTELWESHQRGDFEIGEWRCRFVATDDPTADDE
jgi:hypothetical protein